MARFRATGAVVIGAVKYPAGTVFADAPGAVLPGDVLWQPYPPGLTAANVGPNLVPLDAGAVAMMGKSRFAGVPSWPADGASSIR
jgi:hypothetical protein